MNEDNNQSFKERLKDLLRPLFLVALVIAFVLGAGLSTLLADTHNKVSAAYNSGLEQGQSDAEASYNSLLQERENEFSSQLVQQQESFESEIQVQYDAGHSDGFEEGQRYGYSQGQSEAQSKIEQLENTLATYEQKSESNSISNQTTTEFDSDDWGIDSDYIPESQGGIVYWTPNGKSYHSTKSCTTLRRSKNILSGTVSEASSSGHGDPCNVCY